MGIIELENKKKKSIITQQMGLVGVETQLQRKLWSRILYPMNIPARINVVKRHFQRHKTECLPEEKPF